MAFSEANVQSIRVHPIPGMTWSNAAVGAGLVGFCWKSTVCLMDADIVGGDNGSSTLRTLPSRDGFPVTQVGHGLGSTHAWNPTEI